MPIYKHTKPPAAHSLHIRFPLLTTTQCRYTKTQSHLLHTHFTFNSLHSQTQNAVIQTPQSHLLHTHSTFNSLHSQPYNADIQTHKATSCTLTPQLIPSPYNHTTPIYKHTKRPAAHSLHIYFPLLTTKQCRYTNTTKPPAAHSLHI